MEKLFYKGFNYSGCSDFNILLKENNIYVMDNHGAALWTWAQHIKPNEKYYFIHIDRHYDTLDSNIELWIDSFPDNLKDYGFKQFINLKYSNELREEPTVRWDNYIPIFDKLYKNNIIEYLFFTHQIGNSGIDALLNAHEWPIVHLFENFEMIIMGNKEKVLLNIDIDFFIGEWNKNYFQLFSNKAVDSLLFQIYSCLSNNKIEVVSIALSPECCGGWSNSIKMYNKIAERLGLEKISRT